MWDRFKKVPKMLLLGEIVTFLLLILGGSAFLLLLYGLVGDGSN